MQHCLVYIIVSLVRFFTRAFRRTLHRHYLKLCLKRCISIILWIYLAFNILWGLNYDRMPIADQMHLETRQYSKEDLQSLVGLLVSRMNDIDSASRIARNNLEKNDSLFRHSIESYHLLGTTNKADYYPNPSVKFSFLRLSRELYGVQRIL